MNTLKNGLRKGKGEDQDATLKAGLDGARSEYDAKVKYHRWYHKIHTSTMDEIVAEACGKNGETRMRGEEIRKKIWDMAGNELKKAILAKALGKAMVINVNVGTYNYLQFASASPRMSRDYFHGDIQVWPRVTYQLFRDLATRPTDSYITTLVHDLFTSKPKVEIIGK